MGRKAGRRGIDKGIWARRATCIPSLWHSQEHEAGWLLQKKLMDRKKKITDHQGAEARADGGQLASWKPVGGFDGLPGRWTLEAGGGGLVGLGGGLGFGRLLAPAPPKPLAAKTPPAPVLLSLAGSSKAFVVSF